MILLFIAWLAAEGRQWLLARRAERLLADVKSLDLNHSSWSEAQRLMKRWGKWGRWYGRCNFEECQYSIYMDGSLFAPPQDDPEGRHIGARLLDHVGLRSSWVSAGFSVVHGVVTYKGFETGVALPVRDWETPDGAYEPWLDIKFSEAATLRYDKPRLLARRPNHAFIERRDRLEANFTPQESPEEQTALMNFQLGCITRWFPCQSRSELLPRANEEYEADNEEYRAHEAQVDQWRRQGKGVTYPPDKNFYAPTCFPTVELRAREERDVLVGDVVRASVVGAPWEEDREMIWKIEVRLLKILKGKTPGPVGSIFSVYERGDTGRVAVDRPWPFREVLITGMTAEGWGTHNVVVYSGDCGTVEATPENIAAAQKGVAQDFGQRQ